MVEFCVYLNKKLIRKIVLNIKQNFTFIKIEYFKKNWTIRLNC